ncbi:MAG: hypothetical protein AAFX93_20100 [Verrucomicrobiota bacterium]
MNWLNIETKTLRSEEYVSSEPTERAAWLSLTGWCAEQENGGVIKDCRNWKDRKWQQLCGVFKNEVDSAENLLVWKGDDLCVLFYPVEKEAEIRAKRKAGKVGGKASGKARRNAASEAQLKAEPEAPGEAELQAEPEKCLNGKEVEGERKGKEEKGSSTLANANVSNAEAPDPPESAPNFKLEPDPPTKAKEPKTPAREIVEAYNEILGLSLPKARAKTDSRQAAIRRLWKFLGNDLGEVRAYFRKVAESDFLCGRGRKQWRGCNLDWLCKQEHIVKIIEGNYDN